MNSGLFEVIFLVCVSLELAVISGCKDSPVSRSTKDRAVIDMSSADVGPAVVTCGGVQLPLNEITTVVKVCSRKGGYTCRKSSVASRKMSAAWESVISTNNIKNSPACCHFILGSSMEVIGFSFSSSLLEGCTDLADSSFGGLEVVRNVFPSYRGMGDLHSTDSIQIASLGNLKYYSEIEFFDFGSCGFENGIWKELAQMSRSGKLRGVSTLDGESFLGVRGGTVIPELRGLVVKVKDISKIREFGEAFPNLSFLCVAVERREQINALYNDVLSKNYFPHLKAIMVGESEMCKSELFHNGYYEDKHDDKGIVLDPNFVPPSVKWIGMDGNLMARNDMIRYDAFGARLRFREGKGSLKVEPDRDIDVVYMGYGFSSRGARGVCRFEYAMLEKYWRLEPRTSVTY